MRLLTSRPLRLTQLPKGGSPDHDLDLRAEDAKGNPYRRDPERSDLPRVRITFRAAAAGQAPAVRTAELTAEGVQ